MSAEPVPDLRTSDLRTAEQRDLAAAARERADRTTRGLTELLDARPDLLGVHAPADWAYDAVRWSA